MAIQVVHHRRGDALALVLAPGVQHADFSGLAVVALGEVQPPGHFRAHISGEHVAGLLLGHISVRIVPGVGRDLGVEPARPGVPDRLRGAAQLAVIVQLRAGPLVLVEAVAARGALRASLLGLLPPQVPLLRGHVDRIGQRVFLAEVARDCTAAVAAPGVVPVVAAGRAEHLRGAVQAGGRGQPVLRPALWGPGRHRADHHIVRLVAQLLKGRVGLGGPAEHRARLGLELQRHHVAARPPGIAGAQRLVLVEAGPGAAARPVLNGLRLMRRALDAGLVDVVVAADLADHHPGRHSGKADLTFAPDPPRLGDHIVPAGSELEPEPRVSGGNERAQVGADLQGDLLALAVAVLAAVLAGDAVTVRTGRGRGSWRRREHLPVLIVAALGVGGPAGGQRGPRHRPLVRNPGTRPGCPYH